ncbi:MULTISPECIES: hypothetical protein [unclassified Pyramidobacter]|uniref:hypothetical protein n=1 Tax=unclassified Pyramidobacter TaxID=2632171 RepID=UPI0013154AD7|nr:MULTISPECIES: hypothetical protein [unclassified Pyramidobacter]WOL41039.1 hypothetical protein RAH42_05200 [Pyramidobacter sp. YE332]
MSFIVMLLSQTRFRRRAAAKTSSFSGPRRMPAHVFETDTSISDAWKKASPVRVKP